MYITDYINGINEQISILKARYNYLALNMEDISKQSANYKKEEQINYLKHLLNAEIDFDLYFGNSFSLDQESQTNEANIIRKDLIIINEKINSLRKKRDELIDKFLRNAKISVKDALWLLEQNGLFYKAIHNNGETLLVPSDTYLTLRVGNGQVIDYLANKNLYEEPIDAKIITLYRSDINVLKALNSKFKELLLNVNIPQVETKKKLFKKKEEKTVINYDIKDLDPFIKTENGIKINPEVVKIVPMEVINKVLNNIKTNYWDSIINAKAISPNNRINDLTSALKVSDIAGIPIYLPNGNNIKLNKDILNIFPYEVLAFLDYYVTNSFDSNKSIQDIWQEYNTLNLKRS